MTKQEYKCMECGAVIEEAMTDFDKEEYERKHGEPPMDMPSTERHAHLRKAHADIRKFYSGMFRPVTLRDYKVTKVTIEFTRPDGRPGSVAADRLSGALREYGKLAKEDLAGTIRNIGYE
jgi:hypothetical protein